MVLKIVRTVWPVMLTYVAIGAPCGMIMGQTGMEPWMVFALSSTFVTGSGQFMICNLWLAGVPAASIVASVAAISSRFALYSASIAPHLRGASKRQTLAVAPHYRGPGLYPVRCLCRAGRQRLGEPRRVRRGTLACPGSLDCGRRRRGRGGQDKIDAVVLRLGHRTLYCLEPYIGVASRAPNLVPSQLVEFFTELVYFFWYHGQTLL